MSRYKPKTQSKSDGDVAAKADAYHHGNLRLALLTSAWETLEQDGLEALTLREVARRAGVSTAAPYHHFASKAELIGQMVQDSLTQLDQISQQASQSQKPQEQLEAIGQAYVLFAVQHPARFRLMFRAEIRSPLEFSDPAQAPVFRVLLQVIEGFGLPKAKRFNAAITAWSLVHGLATLLVDGPLQNLSSDPKQVRQLSQQITAQLRFSQPG